MNNQRVLSLILALSGMIGVLFLAFFSDQVLMFMLLGDSQSTGISPLLVWLYPVLELVWMLAGLALFWYVVNLKAWNHLVSAIFLVIGLLIVFTGAFIFMLPVPEQVYMLMEFVSPSAYLYHAGALVTVTGIMGFWFAKKGGLDSADAGEDEGEVETEDKGDLPAE